MKVPLRLDKPIEELPEKVVNQINLITKVDDVQITLLLLRQVNNAISHLHSEDYLPQDD